MIGESSTFIVRKSNGDTKEYTITHLKALIETLDKFLLTPPLLFWSLYWIVVTLLFSTTIISAFIFRVRKTDWTVTLVATSMLLLPYTLNEFISFFQIMGNSEMQNLAIPAFFGLKFGSVLLLLTMYIFPDGHLYPAWIKWVLIPLFIFTPRIIGSELIVPLFISVGVLSPLIWISLLVGAIVIQIYKYKKISTPVEKQQIKWVTIGIVGIILVLSTSEVLYQLEPIWWVGHSTNSIWEGIFISLRSFIFSSALLMLSSITFAIAIYHFRLWDADIYINRAFIYGLVTGILAVIWTGTVALLQFLIQQFTTEQPPLLAAILSSVQVAALFTPVRMRVEKWVNERFYKDRVDFTEAIIELQAEKWQFISSKDMFQLLVSKTPRLIKSISSALYLDNGKEFDLLLSYGIDNKDIVKADIEIKSLEQLKKGKVVKMSNEKPYALLIPLTVHRGHVNDLIGILALGAREEGRGYSRDHISDLTALGKSAGVAIHFLQLNEKKNTS